jgi:uncharacterized tellurite resistance protein B-like protein
MLDGLTVSDRLELLKFMCAFAWVDLEVSEKERAFVKRILALANLGETDTQQVETWLQVAPSPASVDPKNVPAQHRRLFIEAIRAVVYADGKVDPEERAALDQLKAALLSAP